MELQAARQRDALSDQAWAERYRYLDGVSESGARAHKLDCHEDQVSATAARDPPHKGFARMLCISLRRYPLVWTTSCRALRFWLWLERVETG